ncbi:MAG: hypothetical protein JXQ75_19970 [Phycisphaerae bacterium]|nr:hypothetical protein [Phycisphaerae bacterium]
MRAAWMVAGGLAAGLCMACVADDRPTSRASRDEPVAKATSRPATMPARQATPPEQVKPSSGDAKVDEILDRLEIKGQAIEGLGCKLTYKYVMVEPVEDSQTKEGTLLFARAEPNSKFLIRFTKMIADGIVSRRGEHFLFDGEWLTERNDKARTIIRRQIVRKGERIDPFKLGKGPFPLPFGQKREEILRNFKVTLQQFELGDPRNTHHLHCVPLPNTELASKYSRVEIYVDKTTELPVRVETERLSDGNRIEVDFKEIDTSEAPALSRFQIKEPGEKLDGFSVTEEPLPPLPANGGVAPTGGG